jgi:hypothetical protein
MQAQEGMHWQDPAINVNYRLILSSKSYPIITNVQLSKENSNSKKKLVTGPRW